MSATLRDLALLLGLQAQIGWNSFRKMRLWKKILNVLLLGLGGLSFGFVSALAGLGAGSLLRRLPEMGLGDALPPAEVEALLPGVILTAIALFLLMTSFGLALGSLFFSRDLEMLMSAPVDRRAVFISKLLGGFTGTYALVFITAVPALVAYGIGLGYGPAYYVLMLVAVLGSPLLPAGLGAVLVMLVARVVPAQRVREVMALVAAIFGSACALIGNTTSVWMRQLTASFGTGTLESALNTFRGLANLPVPSLWAGRGLAMAGAGNVIGGLAYMTGFLLITFGFFAGCVWLAEHMYTSGWLRMQSAGTAKRKPRPQIKDEVSARGAAVPPFLSIAFKDWRIIPRDLRNFAQYLSPLFLLPLVYIQLFANTSERSGKTLAQQIGTLDLGADVSNILLAGTVLISTIFVFSRAAQTGISMEGRSYWILKAAPITRRELLLGKFVTAYAPFGVLSTVLLIAAALLRGFAFTGFLYGWFGVQLLGAAMLAMDVGLSTPWAHLDWDDPRKMHSGWAGLIALVGYGVIGVFGGLSLALPYLAGRFLPVIAPFAWVLGPFLAIGISGLVAAGALALGFSRLGKVGE